MDGQMWPSFRTISSDVSEKYESNKFHASPRELSLRTFIVIQISTLRVVKYSFGNPAKNNRKTISRFLRDRVSTVCRVRIVCSSSGA